jgi:formylglycine-generating enzyme required for sulfatase activity
MMAWQGNDRHESSGPALHSNFAWRVSGPEEHPDVRIATAIAHLNHWPLLRLDKDGVPRHWPLRLDKPGYRLPTEAEWEYACRAGTVTPFFTGDALTTAQANYNGKEPYGKTASGQFRQRPTRAGGFPANAWGLHDMHGNVWEWTADWYGPYPEGDAANIDPHGPAQGAKRVIRGGSWFFDANSARCGLRYTHSPQDKGFSLGLRLAADRRR